jgi:hypothetical protein
MRLGNIERKTAFQNDGLHLQLLFGPRCFTPQRQFNVHCDPELGVIAPGSSFLDLGIPGTETLGIGKTN